MSAPALKKPFGGQKPYPAKQLPLANDIDYLATIEQFGILNNPKDIGKWKAPTFQIMKSPGVQQHIDRSPTLQKPNCTPKRNMIDIVPPLKSPKTPIRILPVFLGVKSPTVPQRPTTPLFYKKYDNDPWFYNGKDISKNVIVNGILKDGTVAPVPTATNIPILTNSSESEFSEGDEIDPMVMANIYINSYDNNRNNNHVNQNMKNISTSIKSLRSHYTMKMKVLTNDEGLVKQNNFEDCLSIYENNQVYYQECIDHCTLTKKELVDGLSALEYWFICIVEPPQQDEAKEWREREYGKIKRGYSAYCDPELCDYIKPLSPKIIQLITLYHKQLDNNLAAKSYK